MDKINRRVRQKHRRFTIFTNSHTLLARFVKLSVMATLVFSFAVGINAQDDDNEYISPVRPTVSDSATVQKKGVLQIEYGGDFDFRSPEYSNQQLTPLGVYFAVNKRLRLDLEFDTVVSQKAFTRETGVGDVSVGFKSILREDPEKHLAVALSYKLKIPAADEEKGLGTGRFDHNLLLIFDRAYGKNDFIANFSYLNIGRDDSRRRASGGQIVFAYERKLPKNFSTIFEFVANSVNADLERGLYAQAALTYQVNKRLVLDFGARPGFGCDAPKFNLFGGLSIGVANLFKKK